MACSGDGFCWDSYTDLCGNIGSSCISKNVIFDMIANQSHLADAIAPVLPGVEVIPTCSRVYLDPDSCTYTSSSAGNNIPVGIHLFDGRVALDGQQSCANVNPNGNDLPQCGDILNNDLTPIADGGTSAFIMLQDYQSGGCNMVMKLPGQSFAFFDDVLNVNSTIIGPGGSHTNGPITIPQDGLYMISQGVGFTPTNSGCIGSGIAINSVLSPQIASSVDPACEFAQRASFTACLNDGDQVEQVVGWTGPGVIVLNADGFQVSYVGDCS